MMTVEEGVAYIVASLIGTKLAEEVRDIYLQKQHSDTFEFLIRGLEESLDLSMHSVAKPLRRLMSELNSPKHFLELLAEVFN